MVQTKDIITAAAAGLARPMNQRLSTTPTWVLNRASRNAAQAAYRKDAAHPALPIAMLSSLSEASAQ